MEKMGRFHKVYLEKITTTTTTTTTTTVTTARPNY